jgi:hypothetical protein
MQEKAAKALEEALSSSNFGCPITRRTISLFDDPAYSAGHSASGELIYS